MLIGHGSPVSHARSIHIDTTGAVAEAVAAMWTDFDATGVPRPLDGGMRHVAKGVQDLIGMPIYWEIEAREAARRSMVAPERAQRPECAPGSNVAAPRLARSLA